VKFFLYSSISTQPCHAILKRENLLVLTKKTTEFRCAFHELILKKSVKKLLKKRKEIIQKKIPKNAK